VLFTGLANLPYISGDNISNITVNGVPTKLYDSKLYTSLISTDDSHNLQDVLSNALVWSKDWQLQVNVRESHVLHLHKNNPLMDYYFDQVVRLG